MICRDVQNVIESLAADEMAAARDVRDHLTTCVRCAAALALARRIESSLRPREMPRAPARFTAAVLARVRRDRWRAEQRVDRAFNVTIMAAGLLLVVGVVMLLNLSGVAAITSDMSRLIAEGFRVAAARLMPALPAYLAGMVLLITAVGVWWWAERTA